jgi:hypothetical protein
MYHPNLLFPLYLSYHYFLKNLKYLPTHLSLMNLKSRHYRQFR